MKEYIYTIEIVRFVASEISRAIHTFPLALAAAVTDRDWFQSLDGKKYANRHSWFRSSSSSRLGARTLSLRRHNCYMKSRGSGHPCENKERKRWWHRMEISGACQTNDDRVTTSERTTTIHSRKLIEDIFWFSFPFRETPSKPCVR